MYLKQFYNNNKF